MEADRLRCAYVDPRRGQVTLREYAERKWLPSQFHLRPNSADTYAAHRRNHIYPAFGGQRMDSLTRTDMKAFGAATVAKFAPSQQSDSVRRAAGSMASAVDDGVIRASPWPRVALPRADRRVIEPMPADAGLLLAGVITPRYRVAAVLGRGRAP